MAAVQETIDRVKAVDVSEYKYGFFSDIEAEKAPKGLNEDIVRFISAKKNEPAWLTEWRLEAYRRWLTMQEPNGRGSIIRRSTIKSFIIIPRRRRRRVRSRSPTSIRNS